MPLIPLVLTLAPALAHWLFGAQSDKTTQAIVQAAAAVTGTADPQAQMQALQDPAKANALQVELLRIAAQMQAEQRSADLADLQARLMDVAGARSQTVALAEAHSAIAWGAPVMSGIVLIAFGGMLVCILVHSIPEGSAALANVMLGTLATMASSVVNYWTGSNAGSRGKDATIAEQSRSLATSAPVVPPR